MKSLGLQLGDGQIKDIKFADNNTLLVLWESNGELCSMTNDIKSVSNKRSGTTSLLSIPYRGHHDGNLAKYAMSYSPLTPTSHPKPTVFNDKEVVERFSKYRIPSEESFVPEKMEIRERTGRAQNNETGRIVIVGRDRLHYKVFKLAVQDMEGAADGDIPMS
jgi:anaphase-promoting complex subunit 4